MNIFSKFYCRAYQFIFKCAIPLLPYRSPKIINFDDLNEILKKENVNKVCIVSDKIVYPIAEEFIKKIDVPYCVYDKVKPNPTISLVEDAKKFYLENNCTGILAIGGGSVIDLAKVLGARVVKNKKIEKMSGLLKIRKKLPPLIAVPSTAGTGSETTLAAVITDEKTHHKYPINDFCLIPPYAILEPKLLVNLPPFVTATTGMDALTHAVEAFIGKSPVKKTREKAINAVKLIVDNLYQSYLNPHNLEYRGKMLIASFDAGVAFTISYVGYVHAIAHSLGGQYNIPHGEANAIILPIMLKVYGKSCYNKLAILSRESKVALEKDSDQVAAEKFISFIEYLNQKMGIRKNISEIKLEDIPNMAKYAIKEANPLYPCPKLFSLKELSEVYKIIGG